MIKKIGMVFTLISIVITQVFAAPLQIRFATEAVYPPFVSMDAKGNFQGYDVDIVRALCAQLKAQCTFSNQPWDSLIPSLKLGKFDALFGGLDITEARKRVVDFSNVYYQSMGSYAAPVSTHVILTPQGMKGKVVGTQQATTFVNYLQTTFGNDITIKTYPSLQEAFLDLVSGRVDVVLGDTPVVYAWIKKQKTNQYAIVGNPIVDKKLLGEGSAIAVQKGNTALLNALNKALAAIKANGVYDHIVTKYFGTHTPPISK